MTRWSLPAAMRLPTSVIIPTITARTPVEDSKAPSEKESACMPAEVIDTSGEVMPIRVTIPTSAEAPPPRPLSRPTISGISIILTLRAIIKPITRPMRMKKRVQSSGTMPCPQKATRIARIIARMLVRLPLTDDETRLIIQSPASTRRGIIIVSTDIIGLIIYRPWRTCCGETS